MKKLRTLVLGAALVGLAACVPTFPEEGQLTAEDMAPAVALSWPAAAGVNGDWPVTGYQISLDGDVVSVVDDWAEGCLLYGLADETSYQIEVRAVDGREYLSEPLSVQHVTGLLDTYPGEEIVCSTAPPME
jgi:hypothetical protein